MDNNETVQLLKEIKHIQETVAERQVELLEYLKAEEQRKQKLVSESVELQRQSVKRQKIMLNVAYPILILGGAWVVYMIFKYL